MRFIFWNSNFNFRNIRMNLILDDFIRLNSAILASWQSWMTNWRLQEETVITAAMVKPMSN